MQVLFPKGKTFQLGVLYTLPLIIQVFIEVWGFLAFGVF